MTGVYALVDGLFDGDGRLQDGVVRARQGKHRHPERLAVGIAADRNRGDRCAGLAGAFGGGRHRRQQHIGRSRLECRLDALADAERQVAAAVFDVLGRGRPRACIRRFQQRLAIGNGVRMRAVPCDDVGQRCHAAGLQRRQHGVQAFLELGAEDAGAHCLQPRRARQVAGIDDDGAGLGQDRQGLVEHGFPDVGQHIVRDVAARDADPQSLQGWAGGRAVRQVRAFQ
jgi:hypothetical protein